MKDIDLSYSDFKSRLTSKALQVQYVQTGASYFLFAIEAGVISWQTNLVIGSADANDFETNLKATANAPLEIKAGAGRPTRVSASPQPINTIQHFKGYQLALQATQTTAYIDISFDTQVYVKGGYFYCSSILTGDNVTVDLLYGANDMVVVPGIVDTCYLVPNQQIPFISAESMALAPQLKLRITLKGTTSLTPRTVYIIAEYFV
jgi:hypothetical protein